MEENRNFPVSIKINQEERTVHRNESAVFSDVEHS